MYLDINGELDRIINDYGRRNDFIDVYGSGGSGWFRYIALDPGTCYRTYNRKLSFYCMIFMQRGFMSVYGPGEEVSVISNGETTLLNKDSDVFIETDTGCECLVCVMEGFPNLVIEKSYARLLPLNANINFSITSVKIIPPLQQYIGQVRTSLETGLMDSHLSHIKVQELFLIIRKLYPREKLLTLMWPLLIRLSPFSSFVINNYRKVDSVAELIKLSPFGQTQFKQKFKKEFGMTAQQWILKQKSIYVKSMLADPKMCINDIIALCSFSSPSELTRFCKKYLGDTPTNLMACLRRD